MQSEMKTIQMNTGSFLVFSGSLAGTGIFYAGRSDQGGRSAQEDRILSEKDEENERLLCAVCDGMGGMQGGSLASGTVSDLLRESFRQGIQQSPPVYFRSFAERADEAVCALTQDGRRLQAGTTIVAALLEKDSLYWLSVGDSRIYLYRTGTLICPVPAHNYWLLLNEMVAEGRIGKEQFLRESRRPNAHGLISYLGIGGVPRMEINARPFRVLPGDKILLCSDGLFRSLTDQEIRRVLETDAETAAKADLLTGAALENGGSRQDNTSVILIEKNR